MMTENELHRSEHGVYAFWSPEQRRWVTFTNDLHFKNTVESRKYEVRFLRVDYSVPLPRNL